MTPAVDLWSRAPNDLRCLLKSLGTVQGCSRLECKYRSIDTCMYEDVGASKGLDCRFTGDVIF